MFVLLSDTTKLETCEDCDKDNQSEESHGRKNVPHGLREIVACFFERENGDIVAILQSPLDVEAVLANEHLAKGPLIDHVSGLIHIRVLVLEVPESEVAERGA